MTRSLWIGALLLSACGNVEDTTFRDAAVSDGKAVDSPAADAAPDASVPAFEVVYGDDWRVAVEASNDGWFLLVANGNSDPDLSTI